MLKIVVDVIQNLIIQWKCPNCNKKNQKTVYENNINDIPLQCNYCGKEFIGE